MEKLKFNPKNEKYYSADFIKGFECGVERQFEKDKAELTPITRGKWIKTVSQNHPQAIYYDYKCSNCSHHRNKPMPYCEICGAKMKGDTE